MRPMGRFCRGLIKGVIAAADTSSAGAIWRAVNRGGRRDDIEKTGRDRCFWVTVVMCLSYRHGVI